MGRLSDTGTTCHMQEPNYVVTTAIPVKGQGGGQRCRQSLWVPGGAIGSWFFRAGRFSFGKLPFRLLQTSSQEKQLHLLTLTFVFNLVLKLKQWASNWGTGYPQWSPKQAVWVTSTPWGPEKNGNEMKSLPAVKQTWERLCNCFYLFNSKDWLQQLLDGWHLRLTLIILL